MDAVEDINDAVIGGANFDASNERSFELFKTIAQRHFETIADYDALSVNGRSCLR